MLADLGREKQYFVLWICGEAGGLMGGLDGGCSVSLTMF